MTTFPPSDSISTLNAIVPGPFLMSPTRRKPQLQITIERIRSDSLTREEASPTPRSPDLLMPPSIPKEPATTPRTNLYNEYNENLVRARNATHSTHKKIKTLCVGAVFKCAPSCITHEFTREPNHCPQMKKANLQKLKENVKCIASTAGCCSAIPCVLLAIASCGYTLRGEDCCCTQKKSKRVAPE